MQSKYPRARVAAAVAVAFVCGLVFASGFDLTRFGWAQAKAGNKPTAEQVQPLVETQNAFEAIADHVTPAVVSIQTERLARGRTRVRGRAPGGLDDLFRQFEPGVPDNTPQESSGSGFIVSKDGYILTNNHVVADADRVMVGLLDKRQFPARVIGRDPTTDVAVIKVDAKDLPTVALGDDGRVRVGQWVVAIGNPLQLDFTVTAGIISAKGRSLPGLLSSQYAIQDFIQTDAAINPGNSGGPLVNIRGEVVGINSAIASSTGFYAGYGFAIPINLAKQVMNDIIEFGRVRRAVLGINIADVDPKDAEVAGLKEIRGVKVGGFSPPDAPEESPARKAGVEVGDVIVAINGHPVERVSTLQREIRGFKPGDVVTVDVMRFRERKSLRVRLAEPPSERGEVASADAAGREPVANERVRTYDKLGIAVAPISPELASRARLTGDSRRGVMVTDVSPTGPSYHELFASTDVIVRVLYPAKKDIRDIGDLEQVLGPLKTGDLVTLMVLDTRGPAGSTRSVTLRVGG